MLTFSFQKLSTFIKMFSAVSFKFMIFLMWYISIIVAFGLAFFFILQREDPSDGEEAKNEYFENPQKSLLKTVVMSLTGELEFADIDFGMEYAMYGKLVRVIYMWLNLKVTL